MVRGCLDYFPAALAEVARVSKVGNDQHNPGEEMYHARGKSMDHADCIVRHLADRGRIDPHDGMRHTAKVAWRALALLQEELEAEGAPMARAARAADPRGPLSTTPAGRVSTDNEPEAEVKDWTPWDGRINLPPAEVVTAYGAGYTYVLLFRNGAEVKVNAYDEEQFAPPGVFRWVHLPEPHGYDIVAYRIDPWG